MPEPWEGGRWDGGGTGRAVGPLKIRQPGKKRKKKRLLLEGKDEVEVERRHSGPLKVREQKGNGVLLGGKNSRRTGRGKSVMREGGPVPGPCPAALEMGSRRRPSG